MRGSPKPDPEGATIDASDSAAPMRLMLLATEMRPGGAERIVHDLARGLDRSVVQPLVAALDGRGEYAERIRKAGVEVIDLGAYRRTDAGVVWRLRRLLRERSIQLLHTHLIHASVVGRLAARPLSIPVLATAHIVDRRPVWWHFMLDRWTARWCRQTVCVSVAVKRFLQQRTRLPESHYRVIHNGIDLARFARPTEKGSARGAFCIPDDGVLVGALGRFDRQKGLDVFLHALARLKGAVNLPPWRAALAGYGPEEKSLRALVTPLGLSGQVHWVGYREADAFLPALDVAVVPSRWEGFGLVLVESFAAGRAVVASDVDSIPEIATHGENALLVPPENPEALAGSLAELIADSGKRERLASAARQRAQSFSLESMLRGYTEAYRAIR